ncbi:MAG: thiol reductase thioredoxin [Nitrospirae bacterium]|nr:thiol reductase thioredoxin [Candidatus Manganitrophaceae bacterium]
MIPEITDRSFDQMIETSSVPVLVAFWSPTCRNCKVLLYELDQLSEEQGEEIAIYKMDVTENYQIPAEYEISSLPTLAFFSKGKFVQFIGGLGKKSVIQSAIEKALRPKTIEREEDKTDESRSSQIRKETPQSSR